MNNTQIKISFVIVPLIALLSLGLFTKAQAFLKASPGQKPAQLFQPVAILGKDDRKPLPDKFIPLASGIGIIGQPGRRGWSCTAFCVAPNVIATNAHCIVKNPTVGRRLNLARTIFMLPKFNDKPRAKLYLEKHSRPLYVDPQNPALSVFSGRFQSTRSVRSQSEDWAFTKLRHDVCKGRTLDFQETSLNEIFKATRKNQLFMIGFHGDKKMNDRLFSSNCRVRSPGDKRFFLPAQRRQYARQAYLLPHTCDAYKGSSGSPIIVKTEEGPKVIGINLGSLRYERYQIKKNRYTGKVISRKKLRSGRETNMAVRPRAFLDGLARFERENLLTSKTQIQELQTYLKALKFYRGRIDGVYGSRSQRALRAFEKKQKITPIGLPTIEILHKLKREVFVAQQS